MRAIFWPSRAVSRSWTWLPVMCCAAAIARAASGQIPADAARPAGALLVRVVDTADAMIAGAEVSFPAMQVSFPAPQGSLFVDHVRPGLLMVQARRLGFAPQVRFVVVRADTQTVRFVLSPSAVVLEPVTVTSTGGSWFDDFDRHRKAGQGQFLTAADLENAYALTEALRRMRGLKVSSSGAINLQRAGGQCGGGSMLIFLDGVLLAAVDEAALSLAQVRQE